MSEIRVLRILWAGILSSTALISGLALALPPAEPEPQSVHLMVLGALALANAITSFVLPEHTYKTMLSRKPLKLSEEPDPDAAAGFGKASRIRVFADPGRARALGSAAYRSSVILALALSEAVGVFGLVLSQLGHPSSHFLPLLVASVVLVAIRFPSETQMRKRLERQFSARLL